LKKKPVKKAPAKKSLMKKLMGRFLKKSAPKKTVKKMVAKKVTKKVSPPKKTVKKMKPASKKMAKKMKAPKKAVKKQLKAKKMKKPAVKKVASKKVDVKKTNKLAKVEKKSPKETNVAQKITNLIAEEASTESEVPEFNHEPVLVAEILENLQLANKKIVVDGTLGLGGHSKKMLEAMAQDGKLIGFDVDDDNMAVAKRNLQSFGDRAVFVRSNFSNLSAELAKLNISKVDAILLDLGLSSPQVDNAEKGFSFLREGALDMRFDKNEALTAAEVVNSYPSTELVRIFQQYGEEPFARKIVAEIVKQRKVRAFKTTTQLANFIEKLIGRKGHIHPATRVFQALRIEVNHELDVLQSTLEQAVAVLNKHGRLAVIAYHSLEDRVVKQFFKQCALDYINEPDKLTTTHLDPSLYIVTKKPLVPTDAEISQNPRSRSAKLRVAEKL